MGCSKDMYISLLDRLVYVTHAEPYDREAYVSVIEEICKTYNLAKGDTEFYLTPMMEQKGIGENFCDFDNGKGTKVILRIRIVSQSKAVIITTIYGEEGEPERSEAELAELDTMVRIITGFATRRRLIRMMQEFGFTDLDGYLNFRAFSRYIDVENSENRLGGKIAFHIDLHNFTMVNQEVGRANGDIVLKKYYTMIKDAIGDKGIIIRLGGDKFIGIFDRSVKRKVYDIFSGTAVPYGDSDDGKIVISAAAGIYMLPNPFLLKSPGDIMDKIMIAGDTAKRQASESIVVYDDRMKSEKAHVKKVQSEFRNALENEEFAVFYQPKVDIESRTIVGSEALCRWIKDGIIIPPMEFIPILEMNTDICKLDFYMLEHVCQTIRQRLDEGKSVVRVSVNFSRKHLVDIDLLDKIISVIDKYEVPHEYIEIELTETTTDVLFRDLRRVVCGLQEQGIWTAVDDFGVGYSSLNLIREIPWNVLKVDKGFVPKPDEDENSVANIMFRHVIALAHDMGMKCVIEGVESIDQLDILKKSNCYIAQGYFFDRPLPLEEYEERLDRKVYPEITE